MLTVLPALLHPRRCPRWLLLPASALGITATGMLLLGLVIMFYALWLAATHGGVVAEADMNRFGRAAGHRLGPAFQLVLVLLAMRWLVAERAVGYGFAVALAAALTVFGAGIGWLFGHPPDVGDAAHGPVAAAATVLGCWLGGRDRDRARARRRFAGDLVAAGTVDATAEVVATWLGAGQVVDVYTDAPASPRWLGGSSGEPPALLPPADALVRCGPGGSAAAVRGATRADRRLLVVAEVVGLHLERLLLRAEGERAGVRAERERLAGEIHDTIAQSLTAVTTHLEAAAATPSGASPHVHQARSSACGALAELRGLVWALRPAEERVPLAEALQRCVERAAMESGLSIGFATEGTPGELSPEVELCLLRAAQEGLRNAVRHAGPRQIRVTLTGDADSIQLMVDDDGAGFDPGAVASGDPEGGHGLRAMAARVERLGGEQRILAGSGRGTRLLVRLPARVREGSRP